MSNVIKNRVQIESPAGDRAFLLLEGDIFHEPADVYIFNTYLDEDLEAGGGLMARLKALYEGDDLPEIPFYFAPDGSTVGRLNIDNKRTVLLLHTNLKEHEPISPEEYESYIQAVFVSLTALEAYGIPTETIAFPVLLRNALSNIYRDAVDILVKQAADWLKNSEKTKVIKYVLYEKGDTEIWNRHLDTALGRRIVHLNEIPELRQFQSKAISILQRFHPGLPYWKDTLLPIRDALLRKDFRPEVLAAFSRKLLEVYASDLNRVSGHEVSSLDGNLSVIRKENRQLSDWDIQMLYQIRSFGNPSIHRPEPLIGPRAMNEEDVLILLVSLCRLLETVYDFVSSTQAYSFVTPRDEE